MAELFPVTEGPLVMTKWRPHGINTLEHLPKKAPSFFFPLSLPGSFFGTATQFISALVPCDKTLSSCLHWLQADESLWYTQRPQFKCHPPPPFHSPDNTPAPAPHSGPIVARNASPFRAWAWLGKHVNNPETAGAPQRCKWQTTRNGIRPSFFAWPVGQTEG